MILQANQFEKVQAPSGRSTPIVTFDANARVYFSSAFTQLVELEQRGYTAANIYYDPQGRIIAIQLLTSKTEGAFPLKINTQGGAFLNARFFATKYDMMDGEKLQERYKGRYTASKESVEGLGEVYVLNLNQKRE